MFLKTCATGVLVLFHSLSFAQMQIGINNLILGSRKEDVIKQITSAGYRADRLNASKADVWFSFRDEYTGGMISAFLIFSDDNKLNEVTFRRQGFDLGEKSLNSRVGGAGYLRCMAFA